MNRNRYVYFLDPSSSLDSVLGWSPTSLQSMNEHIFAGMLENLNISFIKYFVLQLTSQLLPFGFLDIRQHPTSVEV